MLIFMDGGVRDKSSNWNFIRFVYEQSTDQTKRTTDFFRPSHALANGQLPLTCNACSHYSLNLHLCRPGKSTTSVIISFSELRIT
jgi:hypothetical protein